MNQMQIGLFYSMPVTGVKREVNTAFLLKLYTVYECTSF